MTHPIVIAKSGRQFKTHAAALVALIINREEHFLMLSNPQREGKWEPVNGAYDGGETMLEGMIREIREEAGEQIQVRPISAVHTFNFRYDEQLPRLLCLIFLYEYLGGEVITGDDMAGSEIKWMSLEDINSGDYEIIIPFKMNWVYERAVKLYRIFKDESNIDLQPTFQESTNKYGE